MRNLIPMAMLITAGCSTAPVNEPSLAPRAAETIDPRLPVPEAVPSGAVNADLAQRLGGLVSGVKAAAPRFQEQEAVATRLASAAGPMASESWIAAQQALSRLVEQHGVTTRAAADIDALAANRLEGQHWIRPADREAITEAAEQVDAINAGQSAAIERLAAQLAR